MLGVVNEVPVPRLVPPVAAAYQLMVPADAVAPRAYSTRTACATRSCTGNCRYVFTVAIIGVLAAVVQYRLLHRHNKLLYRNAWSGERDVPVPRLVPPVAAAYQLMVPADAVAPRITVPVPHTLAGVVAVIVGTVFTVAIIGVLAAVVHVPAVAST